MESDLGEHAEKSNIPFVERPPAEALIIEGQALFGKLVQEINRRMIEGIEYEKILDYVFDSLNLLIPYDRIGIAVVDNDIKTVKLSWVRSKIPIRHLGQNYSAPLKGSSLSKLLETGEPRIINDLVTYATENPDSSSTKLILQDGIRSNLAFPLKANNKPVGIVFFSSAKPYTYDHNHIDVFHSIADELAVVVEQGRLKHFFSENSARAQTLRKVLHDLRAPLSVIQGYLDISADENWYRVLDPEAQKIFDNLRRNTQYMLQLIGDLSEFNQLQRELDSLNINAVDPIEFSKEMAQIGKVLAIHKDISFSADIRDLPTIAHFDADRIRRVLENLFTNAVKFSKRGSSISFGVRSDKTRITFAVLDQGQGIPLQEHSKLFQEFGKTSTRPTEGEGSTGLGLAIAKKIVEQHGGKISVTSMPGEGSTFSFWLPL
ncbi:MAG TPA: GAF domain-containing sensor histidine kinase [Bdellovibrionales bacterium]|nr:GAF domain-containing sensor histidine kinase [Bdellovibrionales bacterium]